MQTMYSAFVNSPETVTLGAISPTATTVTVQDITKIPEAPNLLVIGGDRPDAETVLLTAVSGSTLTIQRAVNGSARTWADRTTIARNFTAYDHDAFKANIEALNTEKLATGGNGSNVTAAFSQASTKANIASGEKLSVIFGKLMKWFADLGAAAWMNTGTTGSTVALGNHTHTAAALGVVPTSRKVNGKALSADVNLTAPDVGARAGDWLPTLPEVGGSRENLFINWYFKKIINQKGEVLYTSGYGPDMWRLSGAGVNVAIESDYITISATGGNNVVIRQRFESLPPGIYIVSILRTDGTLNTTVVEWDGSTTVITDFADMGFHFSVDGGFPAVAIRALAGNSVSIIAAKLEAVRSVTDVQTLTYWDGTKYVLNEPSPGPQQELAKCQRYQYKNTNGSSEFIRASMITTNTIYFDIPVSVPMRGTPVIESYMALDVLSTAGGSAITGFTFTVSNLGTNLRIAANKTGHGLADATLNAAGVLFNANM